MKSGPRLFRSWGPRLDIAVRRTGHLQGNQGLHCGGGLPFPVVGLIVFAIVKQLHTKPTTRTEVLTARFMVLLLTCGFPGSGNPGLDGIISLVSSSAPE